MAWSDAARRAAAQARLRRTAMRAPSREEALRRIARSAHKSRLARVNQLTPGAKRSDNVGEMYRDDLQQRYRLDPAQARLLHRRVQKARYGR